MRILQGHKAKAGRELEGSGKLAPTRTHCPSLRSNTLCDLHKDTVGEALLLPHFPEKKTEVSSHSLPPIHEYNGCPHTLQYFFCFVPL